MPRYDYKCEKTGKVFEHFQYFDEPNREFCNCKGKKHKAKKLISTPQIRVMRKNTVTDRKLYKELDID